MIPDSVEAAVWFIGGAAITWLLIRFIRRRPSPPYLLHGEYWVYLPGEEMPPQEAVMDRMLRANPHRSRGKMPIGKDEALLFSDVRLHIALVRRSRIAHVFRPDLFEDHVEPTPDRLSALANSHSFAKVRYISEERVKDTRHLRFLPHAADAIASLGKGSAVYDEVAEKLYTAEEFSAELDRYDDPTSPDFHTQVIWKRSQSGGFAETRGLAKVGHPELATEEMNTDQQVLVTAILEEVVRRLWLEPALPHEVDVSYYEDPYRVLIYPKRRGPAHVGLMRLPVLPEIPA
jgi:hypothetical protein